MTKEDVSGQTLGVHRVFAYKISRYTSYIICVFSLILQYLLLAKYIKVKHVKTHRSSLNTKNVDDSLL